MFYGFFCSEIQVNTGNYIVFTLLLFFGFSRKCVYVDHNSSRRFSKSLLPKSITSAFLARCKEIVLVNKDLVVNYKIFGCNLGYKISVESPFIPPDINSKESIISTYPEKLRTLMSVAKNRNIVCMNASVPVLDDKNNDVYGLDLCLDVFNELAKKYRDLFFIIAIPSFLDTEFSMHIKNKSEKLQLEHDNFFLLNSQIELWPIFEKSLIFLRPTSTDGDSISIHEALYFGCNVIASDVVTRPESTITYRYDNKVDFIKKIEVTISDTALF